MNRQKKLILFSITFILTGLVNFKSQADASQDIVAIEAKALDAQAQATQLTAKADETLKQVSEIETKIAEKMKAISTQKKELGQLKDKVSQLRQSSADTYKQVVQKMKEASDLHNQAATSRKKITVRLSEPEKILADKAIKQNETDANTIAQLLQKTTQSANQLAQEALESKKTADQMKSGAVEMEKQTTVQMQQAQVANTERANLEQNLESLKTLTPNPASTTTPDTKPLTPPNETQITALAQKIKGYLIMAKNAADTITFDSIKKDETEAKAQWVKVISTLASAHKEVTQLNTFERTDKTNEITKPVQDLLYGVHQSVVNIFDMLEKKIESTTGDAQHALFSLYEMWAQQWLAHPLGFDDIKEKIEPFMKKMNMRHDAPASDDEIAPPPPY